MTLTSFLFDAFLKCPTKCCLRSTGQTGSGNAYAEWVREQNEAYRNKAAQRLIETLAEGECAITSVADRDLKTATWRLALDLLVQAGDMEARLHAVERVPSEGQGRPSQFIPVGFVFFNKLTKETGCWWRLTRSCCPKRSDARSVWAKSSMGTTTPP